MAWKSSLDTLCPFVRSPVRLFPPFSVCPFLLCVCLFARSSLGPFVRSFLFWFFTTGQVCTRFPYLPFLRVMCKLFVSYLIVQAEATFKITSSITLKCAKALCRETFPKFLYNVLSTLACSLCLKLAPNGHSIWPVG
jgi:hypothetical protein